MLRSGGPVSDTAHMRLQKRPPYEFDDGPRPKTKHLRFRVKPSALSVCVRANEEEQ